jgi:peptide deformylase
MKLIHSPNPILKQKSEIWDFVNHSNSAAIEKEMLEIMNASKGIGLAANQVGLLHRVFVMKLKNGQEIGCFNPYIVVGDNALISLQEGCLSFPNLWLTVPRHNKITAAFLDNTGTSCIIELEGIDSRCFQHELDHLDGVTFTQHVSDLKLQMARKKQRKFNG